MDDIIHNEQEEFESDLKLLLTTPRYKIPPNTTVDKYIDEHKFVIISNYLSGLRTIKKNVLSKHDWKVVWYRFKHEAKLTLSQINPNASEESIRNIRNICNAFYSVGLLDRITVNSPRALKFAYIFRPSPLWQDSKINEAVETYCQKELCDINKRMMV